MSEEKKPSVDWERIEKDWRAGIKTKLQMSQEHGVSRAAIDKHFKKLGVERDLTEKIRAKADALVTQAAVTQSVTSERLVTTEAEIVSVNAIVQADVRMAHRKDIGRHRALVTAMLVELEALVTDPALFVTLGEIMAAPDENGTDRLNDLYKKVVSLPTRIKGAKELSDTLKTLIALEREAFGIDRNEAPADALTNLLRAIGQSSALPVCDDESSG